MAPKPDKALRCAIYTRKSTDHGLDLEFNSLDAQREACEAYIKSQASEGWRVLPKKYDDPAYSGGNLQRPALQRLLKDIDAGQIDVVVVYKIDRLTRSLTDFAKLVELFDAKAVSFVAITQQFNTTTSMGRLTLNVLLSFAQFERELASERVRDKVAASRKKGKWTGGSVPLGYDVRDKRLTINPAEAKTVKTIFERYLALGSFQKLIAELDSQGIVTKKRALAGKVIGGIPFTYGPLAYLLKNRTYIGETGHDGKWFAGEHEAILNRDFFERVQDRLKSNAVGRAKRRTESGAPLAGLLYDDRGNRMTPTYSVKNGVRYRFYVSSALLKGRKAQAGDVSRVAAADLEAAVIQATHKYLNETDTVSDLNPVQIFERHVGRVTLLKGQVSITLKVSDGANPIVIELPWTKARRPPRPQIDDHGTVETGSKPNPLFVQGVVRAQTWLKLLSGGSYESVEALAKAINLHPKVIRKAIRGAFLSPRITRSLLQQGPCATLTLGDLDRIDALKWSEQERQTVRPTIRSESTRSALRLSVSNFLQ
jgi:site-specific DNA recombinase